MTYGPRRDTTADCVHAWLSRVARERGPDDIPQRLDAYGQSPRYDPVKARLLRVALRQVLERYTPWNYAIDQSFQVRHAVRGPASAIHAYAKAYVSLPVGFAPATAWVVAERHPRSELGLWHVHGLWCGVPGTFPGWRVVKEWLGEAWGWARYHRMPGGNADLAARLVYPTDHATKACPTTFARRSAMMHREEIRAGYRRVWYYWHGTRVAVVWKDGVLQRAVKTRWKERV